MSAAHSSHIEDEMMLVDDERVERLLLRVNMLKKLNSSVMEELFFSDVIGTVKIDNLIPSIICSDICTTNTPADSPRPPLLPPVASVVAMTTSEMNNSESSATTKIDAASSAANESNTSPSHSHHETNDMESSGVEL